MPSTLLRIATRNSPLALWQAQFIQMQLQTHWPHLTIELVPMTTSGDRFLNDNLQKLGGKGLFVKELEEALLSGRADIAVHSMKDVPYCFPEGLSLPVICKRENPYDAFVSERFSCLDDLPKHATIGTSSLRRAAQLSAYRSDLNILPLRGNVGTRLARLARAEYDGIILAAAGLERLNLKYRIRHVLSEAIMLPACGQGALGIECRTDDETTQTLIAPLHHELDGLCVNTERSVNTLLGGGCHTPVAIFCQSPKPNELFLQAKIASPNGELTLSDTRQGSLTAWESLAIQCADNLKKNGALQLLQPPLS